jgi:uncharacterized protein YdaU (DUF1376 family)
VNYVLHEISEYDAATAHLTWMQDCALRRLICAYYRTEKPLPTDMRKLWRLARATCKQERDAVAAVLPEFFTKTDDGWRYATADLDIGALDAEVDRILAARERQRRSRARRRTAQNPVTTMSRPSHADVTPQKTLASLLRRVP